MWKDIYMAKWCNLFWTCLMLSTARFQFKLVLVFVFVFTFEYHHLRDSSLIEMLCTCTKIVHITQFFFTHTNQMYNFIKSDSFTIKVLYQKTNTCTFLLMEILHCYSPDHWRQSDPWRRKKKSCTRGLPELGKILQRVQLFPYISYRLNSESVNETQPKISDRYR